MTTPDDKSQNLPPKPEAEVTAKPAASPRKKTAPKTASIDAVAAAPGKTSATKPAAARPAKGTSDEAIAKPRANPTVKKPPEQPANKKAGDAINSPDDEKKPVKKAPAKSSASKP
ncbi:MAG TPA: hypothetical protein VL995_18985, partial [Cellvibrio sp.]|nr:hypothetical protein [Cellvibrio sp.]